MDTQINDKENFKRLATKIPLPKQPLPPLPKHLLETKNLGIENRQKRCPLQTLNVQSVNMCLPGTSKPKLKNCDRFPVANLDTRHVTIRQRSEDLDLSLKVFKENEDSIISISDDESYLSERNKVKHYHKQSEENRPPTLTPIPKSPYLKLSTIRNIKRSLKRPHSQELQGIGEKKIKQQEVGRNRRSAHDGLKERLESPCFFKRIYMTCITRDYCTDIFMYLLAKECKPLATPRLPNTTRACIINWIMKVNGPDGNPAVLQTAIWYLDSILGTVKVEVDKLQLVAAACYWIAQKIHGPALTAKRLVVYSRNAFTIESLLAAEKIIMCRLKFPSQPVVIQEFITYLSWWCDCARPGEIEVAATFLCMSGLMLYKSLCEELPSAISAASVYNALVLLGKENLVKHLQMCPVYIEIERKAPDLSKVSSILRKAVRIVACPEYEYKAPFEHYEIPPLYIAPRIAYNARKYHDMVKG